MGKGFEKLVSMLFLVLLPAIVSAQFTVSGTVTDNHKKPIPKVSVKLINSTVSTLTDSTGKFSLSITGQSALLEFSATGFVKHEVNVSATVNTVSVQLKKITKKAKKSKT